MGEIRIFKKLFNNNTNESCEEINFKRNANDRWCKVNKPFWNNRSDSDTEHVPKDIFSIFIQLFRCLSFGKRGKIYRGVECIDFCRENLFNKLACECIWQPKTKASSQCWALKIGVRFYNDRKLPKWPLRSCWIHQINLQITLQ